LSLTILLTSQIAIANQETTIDQKNTLTNACYSAYQLKQKLSLSVVLGDSTERQNIQSNVDIHIREVVTSPSFLSKIKNQKSHLPKNVRSFVMLLKPQQNKVDGIVKAFSGKYQHPFLVNLDKSTGALINIESTTNERAIIKEYLGYFDLFQYSNKAGSYRYRNGNGHYKAKIDYAENSGQSITKINEGYITEGTRIEIKQSLTFMEFDQRSSEPECFYRKAHINETFTNILAKKSYIKGSADIKISANRQRALPSQHFFYALTSNLSEWPSFNQQVKLTQPQVFERLPKLLSKLQLLIDDKPAFLVAMKAEKELWPFLADFMTNEFSDSKLVNKIIWSLNRINTTSSVSSLLKVSMSELPSENVYRSILALITSSAEINEQGIVDLKNYLTDLKYSDSSSEDAMLLLRSLGALANHRNQHAPLQSQEIKQYLYSHIEGASEQFKSSIYESIGAMGKSIDRQGVEVLMQGLNEEELKVKNSAINALTKIPYQRSYSDIYVSMLDSKLHATSKEKIIELLGRADQSDVIVKDKLLTIVDEPSTPAQKRQSITSLKQVGFKFSDYEIEILESRLRKETDRSSQKKLASLILKYRRKQDKAQ